MTRCAVTVTQDKRTNSKQAGDHHIQAIDLRADTLKAQRAHFSSVWPTACVLVQTDGGKECKGVPEQMVSPPAMVTHGIPLY